VNRRVEVTEDQREIRRKKRVIEYAEKNERALDLAIEFGDMGTAKAKLQALRGEREGVARELASVRIDVPAVDDLMPAKRGEASGSRNHPQSRHRDESTRPRWPAG
jgi:hypothetical protein